MLYTQRRHPARGVLESESNPTVVFTTVCTKGRVRRLANDQVHDALRTMWSRHVQWIVSEYVVMPDHIHFFAEPGEKTLSFDDWITVWKAGFTRILKYPMFRWQTGSFHHRIRSYEDYNAKRTYMDQNPISAGLVECIDFWPYRDKVFQRFHLWS